MKYGKTLFFFLLLLLYLEASTDRAIYRKNYGNENKVALVIGNSNYTHFSPLKNTLHDAEDMKKILKDKGFDVLYLKDGDLESMEEMVEKFSTKLRKGGVGFFYYAGHGLEVGGKNYLVPVGVNISRKHKVKYKSLSINMIIDEMEDSHNRLNIIVLDACRNDPFSRGGGGLAQINNAEGMYIAFATAPGKVASDGGSGRNGLFTRHLIKHIKQPNLTLNEVFKKTRASVYQESNRKQMPWTSSSVIGDFYFQAQGSGKADHSSSYTSMQKSDRDKEIEKLREEEAQAQKKEIDELMQRKAERKKAEVQNNDYQRERSQNNNKRNYYNYLYVCYDKKILVRNNKPIFEGCLRSNRSCQSIGKSHFGKYPNDQKATDAYQRCISGNPKFLNSQSYRSKNTRNNPFVCYSRKYVKNNGYTIYSGCARASSSCQNFGKLHFGKYPNDLKAHQAFERCLKSNPKFIDRQGL